MLLTDEMIECNMTQNTLHMFDKFFMWQKRSDISIYLILIFDTIYFQVAEKERAQRLLEIYNRMDARSHVYHDGKKFKKSDILQVSLTMASLCLLKKIHPNI